MKNCVGNLVKLTSANLNGTLPKSGNAYLDFSSYYKISSLRGTQMINGNRITSWYITSADHPEHIIGWVYEHEISGASSSYPLDVLEDRLLELNKELEKIKSKIEWMKLSGAEEYSEEQYKVYQALKLIEDSDKSLIEKSKLIANLINGES